MDYQTLVAEHEAIEHLSRAVMRLFQGEPRPQTASHMLEDLSQLVRDHLAHEDPVIYEIAKSAGQGRHSALVTTSLASLEALKEDWGQYLYRWHPEHVARDWSRFGNESLVMLERLNERVTAETAVLYALAVHYGVLPPGE